MGRKRFFLKILVISLMFTASEATALETRWVTIASCSDGDTCTVQNRKKTKLRLIGIDAPETRHNGLPGQPFGYEAKYFLNQRVQGQRVRLHIYGQDRYRRTLASLEMEDGVVVNETLLQAGFAEAYAKERRFPADLRDRYLEIEHEAKSARRGMWVQEDYESPGEYRKRFKN